MYEQSLRSFSPVGLVSISMPAVTGLFCLEVVSEVALQSWSEGDEGVSGSEGDEGVLGSEGDEGVLGSEGDEGVLGSKGDEGCRGQN